MSADQQAGKEVVARLLQRFGCLPPAPDGPVLPAFDAAALAAAIMREVRRAGDYGWGKITVHMDVPDAVLLAGFLKEKSGG